MPTRFISFRASDVNRSKVRTVCSCYLEYDRARTFRQLVIRRLLLLLVGTAALTLGFHLLPNVALFTVAILTTGSAVVCVHAELKARRRFVGQLRDVPRANPFETG